MTSSPETRPSRCLRDDPALDRENKLAGVSVALSPLSAVVQLLSTSTTVFQLTSTHLASSPGSPSSARSIITCDL